MNKTNNYMLTYPAPMRCWNRTEHGYASHPWNIDDIKLAQSAGAWFHPEAGHHFANKASRAFALGTL